MSTTAFWAAPTQTRTPQPAPMASPGRDAPELPAYLPGLGVRGAGGDDALATPESSLLLVHLDRVVAPAEVGVPVGVRRGVGQVLV